jgi:iron complex outermembrane receptor protein
VPDPVGRLLAVLALLLAPPMVIAQPTGDPPLLSEEEFTGKLPVVLSASRLPQPLAEAPAAVTVLDRALIEASGARNLAELFRLVPGFVVGMESGHRHVVSYHGFADQFSRRLQVLIDGRSVYLPSFGGVSWSDLQLALDDIERIEVIRGPNAASYGANAFLATINITTRHAASVPGGFMRANVGSDDIRDGVLRAAGGEGNVFYRLTAAAQQDSGYPQRHDRRETAFLNGRFDWQAGRRDELEYQFGYSEGPRGRGAAGDAVNPPHDQEITSRFQQLRWRHRLEGGGEWSVQFYYNHHESDEQILTDPINVPPFGLLRIPVNYDVRSDRTQLEFQHIVPWERWRLVWGAGIREDQVTWPGFLGVSDAVKNSHNWVFLNLEWRILDQWLLHAGLMAEHHDITGSDTSPRVAMTYEFTRGHTLRAGYSVATRTPTLIEEQSFARFCIIPGCGLFNQTFSSDGNLVAERIRSTELGYLARLATGVTFDVRVFSDRLTRLIGTYDDAYPADLVDGEAINFRNSGEATVIGSEFQVQWRPLPQTRVVAGYANVQIKSGDNDELYSESAPRNSLSLLAMQDFAGAFQASAAYYYQDRMQFLDGDQLNALRRLDLRLAWRFRLADARSQLALVLQNVLGEQDSYHTDGRSLSRPMGYVTLDLQFR